MTAGAVLLQILRDPVEYAIRRWNWKSAIFSPIIRAAIFFFANLTVGWRAASAAALVELLYRGPTAGVYGALTEAFRRADPPWLASVTVMFLLPLLSHSLEATVHYLRGTPHLKTSLIASVCFTAISTLFNLHAMRRGILITQGGDRGTFLSDLRRIPFAIVSFVAAGPKWLFSIARPAGYRPAADNGRANWQAFVAELVERCYFLRAAWFRGGQRLLPPRSLRYYGGAVSCVTQHT